MASQNRKGLDVIGINKNFGDIQAVKDVTLEVHAGEFFTLLGPSGCGKTTLLRIIAGLELPDSGQVLLGGKNINSLPATKRQVNTVFQSYALFPHLSIFENVAFGLRSRKFAQEEVNERVNKRLEMLGLEEMTDRRPHQLSGGQKQRVALARAIIMKPSLLLADEPTGNLDTKTGYKVFQLLQEMSADFSLSAVMVTHNLELAEKMDRCLTLADGKLHE